MHACQLCGGPLGLLGFLGRLAHLLCRDCGMHFNIPRDEYQEDDE